MQAPRAEGDRKSYIQPFGAHAVFSIASAHSEGSLAPRVLLGWMTVLPCIHAATPSAHKLRPRLSSGNDA